MKNVSKFKKPLLFISTLLAVVLSSCIGKKDKEKFKYTIQYSLGKQEIYDVSTGDIIYLEGGKIKYQSFNNGHPDTVIVGGTYVIKNYR